MEKIKAFLNKYKAELLILLGAISSIIATLMTKDGMDAAVGSVLIAVLAIVIEVVKNGITEQSISLLANAIKILIEELGDIEVKEETDKEVVSAKAIKAELTIEDIKQRLRA